MSSQNELEALHLRLEHAAGAGARELVQRSIGETAAEAETNQRLRLPGPALSQILGDAAPTVNTEMSPAQLAGDLARKLADGGAKLVSG